MLSVNSSLNSCIPLIVPVSYPYSLIILQGFNKELEDILKIQKGYAIPDPELREQMKKDNKDFIIPAFRMFLDKFKRLNFTKNPEKYIKYSVQDVAEVVDKLFDMSA